MNSRARYEQLLQDPCFDTSSEQQKSVNTIVDIIQASAKYDYTIAQLLQKVLYVSSQGANLSPATVFQIAADSVNVDQICNPQTT